MKKILLFLFLFMGIKAQSQIVLTDDSTTIQEIFETSLAKGRAYPLLSYLCENIGARMSGSENLNIAINWSQRVMEKFGFDKVYIQEVMVPKWIRGDKEIAFIKENGTVNAVRVCALGGSIGTGNKGLWGKLIEVKSLNHLRSLPYDSVKGKIVFINQAMDPKLIDPFQAYGETVEIRATGAIEAAKKGATGVIVRSLNPYIDDFPHTGSMRYEKNIDTIPAIAISTKGAEFLSERISKNSQLQFYFQTTCMMMEEVKSANVIGEITGTLNPNKIILVGGHLDSWDLGTGAHDDGAGCMQAIEALHLLKQVRYVPANTLRVVLFTNEEFGLSGGKKFYETASNDSYDEYLAAIESDSGGLTPKGFSLDGTSAQLNKMIQWKKYFAPYYISNFIPGYGGADISFFKQDGVPLIGFKPDPQRYFMYHHSELDVFSNVNEREINLGAAAMASMIYMIDRYGF